jgi:hypothetical protein
VDLAQGTLQGRHPFDVEILRVEPGQTPYSYHLHSQQWEFYHAISGRGTVRDEDGNTPIEPGDAFVFPPGKAHQLAENPFGEFWYQPDSKKWGVSLPKRNIIRSEPLDYFDGEE